jgi:hypothetical protein
MLAPNWTISYRNESCMKISALAFIILVLSSLPACERNEAPTIPGWLSAKIAEMEDEPFYALALVVRHEWKSGYYYYVNIPLSSCMYCDVYDAEGNKINWDIESLDDYLRHRTNETLIWKREIKQ